MFGQDTFVAVWKSAGRYVPRAKFTTWLLKITRNLVFNELRRSKRRAHIPMQMDPDAEEIPLKDESMQAPDAAALEKELQEAIDRAIAQLPDTQRMAVILRRYEDMSIASLRFHLLIESRALAVELDLLQSGLRQDVQVLSQPRGAIAGLTLDQLIASSRLDRRVVEAIVQGRYTPSPDQRQRLAAALGITLDEITWDHANPVEHMYGHGPQFGRSP
jgi:RNA polymerase sigma factor (sigma-70 family)